MTNKFIQEGNVIDYVNGTGGAIANGAAVEVVNSIGVALDAIPDTETGPVALEGVFEVPKVSAAVNHARHVANMGYLCGRV